MLLAVDTSTTQIGLALYDGAQAQVIGETLWHGKLRHTTSLAPATAELLERTNTKMDEIEAIGIALGPGSFTSLRVGLAFVKGLAMARHIPLIGIPTLDMLTAAQPALDIQLVAVLQAGRGRLAVSHYHAPDGQTWQPEGEPTIMRINELIESIHSPIMVCGELSADERKQLADDDRVQLGTPTQCTRRPAFLAELAWKRYQANDTDDAASLAPIYVHIGDPIPS